MESCKCLAWGSALGAERHLHVEVHGELIDACMGELGDQMHHAWAMPRVARSKDESVHESAPESLTYHSIFTSDGVQD